MVMEIISVVVQFIAFFMMIALITAASFLFTMVCGNEQTETTDATATECRNTFEQYIGLYAFIMIASLAIGCANIYWVVVVNSYREQASEVTRNSRSFLKHPSFKTYI